jgi:hypothetical protein
MSSVVTELAPAQAQFTTMLMKLGHRPAYQHCSDPDDWFVEEWSELSTEAQDALREFDKRKYTADGYVDFGPGVYWMEDEFFPRLSVPVRTQHDWMAE